jgi:dsDNA-binding SOS-regulon protein
MGAIYRRPHSPYLWIKYYVNGRPVRESTETTKETEAKDFLKRREGAAAEGKPLAPKLDRIRYEEIAADLRTYYAATGKRDLKEAETRLKHLDRFFAQARVVVGITPDRILRYVQARQQEQAANATINRELATLSRMLRLAYKNSKLLRLPPIEKLEEADPRAGFFEREQYEAVSRHLAADLQAAAAIAYAYGGGRRARCSRGSAGTWTSGRALSASTRARRKTRRVGWSTSPRSSRRSSGNS